MNIYKMNAKEINELQNEFYKTEIGRRMVLGIKCMGVMFILSLVVGIVSIFEKDSTELLFSIIIFNGISTLLMAALICLSNLKHYSDKKEK